MSHLNKELAKLYAERLQSLIEDSSELSRKLLQHMIDDCTAAITEADADEVIEPMKGVFLTNRVRAVDRCLGDLQAAIYRETSDLHPLIAGKELVLYERNPETNMPWATTRRVISCLWDFVTFLAPDGGIPPVHDLVLIEHAGGVPHEGLDYQVETSEGVVAYTNISPAILRLLPTDSVEPNAAEGGSQDDCRR